VKDERSKFRRASEIARWRDRKGARLVVDGSEPAPIGAARTTLRKRLARAMRALLGRSK
jgi:hypothetical protein